MLNNVSMKYKQDLEGKKVTVFGLGLHGGGVSVVRFLARCGAQVTVTDLKSQEQLAPSLEKLREFKNINYVLGQHRREDFTQADMIVKSPAIPWNNTYIKTAQEHNVQIEMDSSLFFRYAPCPIIGVTGTKGKTTISLLTARILKMVGEDIFEIGIGQIPVFDTLEKIKKDSIAVFELSSWRLSGLEKTGLKKSPHIAVFKNFLPDHLNYYATMDAYLEDKKKIFEYQTKDDWVVLNHDDAIVRNFEREVHAQIVWFGFSRPKTGVCIYVEHGMIFIDDGIDRKEIVTTRALGLKGKHNIVNAMAAIGACWAHGVSLEKLKKHTPRLEGVPHRLEFVGEVHGVKYYNDTTATIPEAVISALHSFTQSVILVAGGSEKGLQYESFAKSVSHRAKNVVFLKGSATSHMKEALEKVLGEKAQDFSEVSSMESAVHKASELAQSGDVIVLSPGASSFGMFENEFDRGDQFRNAVRKMKRR